MELEFNKKMASKSLSITEKNKNIENNILNKVNEQEYASPEDKAIAIMEAFYEYNKIRPEILLVGSEFSSKMLTNIEEMNSFNKVLRKYQIMEQKALQLEGGEIEGFYPENFAMKLYPAEIGGEIEEEAEVKENYSNDNVSFGTDTNEPAPDLIEPGLIGVADINKDISLDAKENILNKMMNENAPELEERELEEHELEGLTRAQYLEKKLKECLSNYEIEDSNEKSLASKMLNRQESFYYREGKTKMHVFQKNNNDSPYHINLGREPEAQDLVAGLLMVQPKNIANFPLRIKGGQKNMLEVLEVALREIKEDDLFDLNELTVSKGVDKRVLKLIEQVKNEETVTFGVQQQKPKRVRRESPVEGETPNEETEQTQEQEPMSEQTQEQEPMSEQTQEQEPMSEQTQQESNDFEQDSFSITDDELNPTDEFNLEDEEEKLSRDISEEIGVFNKNMDNREEYPQHEEYPQSSNGFDPNEYGSFMENEEQFFEMPENFDFDELSTIPPEENTLSTTEPEENKPSGKDKKKKRTGPKR